MELKINSNFVLNASNTQNSVSKDFSKNEKQEVQITSLDKDAKSVVSDSEALAALDEAKSKDKENKISEHDKKLSKEFAKKLDKKLGEGFASKLEEVAAHNGMKVSDLVGMIYSESGFEKNVVNDEGYTGFIQISKDYFYDPTIDKENKTSDFSPYFNENKKLKVSQQEYLEMSAIQQLDIVDAWMQNTVNNFGHGRKYFTGGEMYALNFMPANVFDSNGEYQQPDGQGGGIFKDVYFPEAKPEEILEGETPEQAARRLDKYGEGNLDLNKDDKLSTIEMQKRIEDKYQQALFYFNNL